MTLKEIRDKIKTNFQQPPTDKELNTLINEAHTEIVGMVAERLKLIKIKPRKLVKDSDISSLPNDYSPIANYVFYRHYEKINNKELRDHYLYSFLEDISYIR